MKCRPRPDRSPVSSHLILTCLGRRCSSHSWIKCSPHLWIAWKLNFRKVLKSPKTPRYWDVNSRLRWSNCHGAMMEFSKAHLTRLGSWIRSLFTGVKQLSAFCAPTGHRVRLIRSHLPGGQHGHWGRLWSDISFFQGDTTHYKVHDLVCHRKSPPMLLRISFCVLCLYGWYNSIRLFGIPVLSINIVLKISSYYKKKLLGTKIWV